jgi:hypothetical protein
VSKTILLLFLVILLLLYLPLFGCVEQAGNSSPTPSSNTTPNTAAGSITVDSYESDIFYDAGYEITMAGVRFPLPTTLNELGPDWRFEEDDRMYSTFGDYDYYEGTDLPLKITGTRLYYKDRPMGLVLMENLDMNDKRNGKIMSVGFDAGDQIDGYAGELKVNGIGIGIPVSELDSLFRGSGTRITLGGSDRYDIVVENYHIDYAFTEYDMQSSELPEESRGSVTSLTIGLNFSDEPYGSHLPS